MYFALLTINSIFSNDFVEAKKYYDLLKPLIKQTTKGAILPYYYYVPKEAIELERAKPKSQERIPSNEINKGSSHLWTQAIWIICEMIGNQKMYSTAI